MKKIALILIPITLIICVFLVFRDKSGNLSGEILSKFDDKKTVSILSQAKTKTRFKAEISRSPEESVLGLSGRESMAQDESMLFIYETPGFYNFWMKDMNFPLDFIWVAGDKIVDLTENVPPPEGFYLNLPIYQPKEPADKVLEINAGLVEKYGIQIGDEIIF